MKKILFFSFLAFSLCLFGQTYCGPLHFGYIDPDDPFWNEDGDEPITLVNFAGINNTSSDDEYIGISHEMFLTQTANVIQGNTYTITIKGNTAGNYTNVFVVFIDWNQNGVLNDAGEVYELTQTITNSTGMDSQQVTHSIVVPATAAIGNTRMRVKKLFDDDDYINDLTNPCIGGDFGQAEDYTVNVTALLSVNDVAKRNSNLKIYPNPVSDVLNIDSASKIKSVKIYDLSGKNVLTEIVETNKPAINVSSLTSGTYVVTAESETGLQSAKIIKK
ncbi:GEVED domain-containing protein [Chryseobacterium balustinum]|uniref:Por secretion system C-terminal sorting domain n=1 Tax=Chryseobacterium balustinum TaxID=246 RepID=A0AAX2IN59_9FLAO|nr:GEVED domain-containing protein [Chryseobacterium balustinum]AZB28952.1 T9SS C-terminal target domain-containing protein [Chryseobacterium balustinum]SKB61653.1 Por secretion system C-terminal sorting domain-containing protein [Chryseobacterium balustinum]SQA91289.1 Por secretion system C-terminal sorting domain [Chryseobacterium balustinum]